MMPLRLGGRDRKPDRILFIGAHCDDIEIGCGGTIFRLVEEFPDAEIRWVIFSSNERRESEARRAAGIFLERATRQAVTINTFRNAYFPFIGADLKDFFEELKQSISPDIVFTHYREDRHQDHRTLSDLTWNTFRSHLILEYEIPKYDGDLGQPNLYVPIPKEMVSRKVETLMTCYATQANHQWFAPDTFTGLMRIRGIECDSPTGFAEAYYARKFII